MEKSISAKTIAIFGVLFALVIVLQALGGSFSIGLITLNFSLIPIVLGAIMFGFIGGAALGFANGVVVLIQVISTPSGFYGIIWTYSPIVTTLICLLKTTIAGGVAGFIFSLINTKGNNLVAVFVASGIVPVINTSLFIVGCLFMQDSIVRYQELLGTYEGLNVLVFVLVALVTFNFFIELAINLIVAPSLSRVLKYIKID